jgi:RNA polymerase sigma-70 factor, ECF subfamily
MSFESELAELRRPLLRFARMQLRNDALAEDAVSETLLAMLEKPDNFEGRSSLRTYATGILKFKVIDLLRQRGREVAIEPAEDESLDDAIDALFVADGHYASPPPASQAQFLEVLQTCVERLPPRLSRIFMMREWLEREMGEICAELGITANNAGVMLHRARVQLRECLAQRWFQEG